jgi:hypothetical protein
VSRGLGKIQRDIVAVLQPARQPGGGPHLYVLPRSVRELAREVYGGEVTTGQLSAVRRAVRGLTAAGHLEARPPGPGDPRTPRYQVSGTALNDRRLRALRERRRAEQDAAVLREFFEEFEALLRKSDGREELLKDPRVRKALQLALSADLEEEAAAALAAARRLLRSGQGDSRPEPAPARRAAAPPSLPGPPVRGQ